jgi:hypothetical protein
MLLSLASTEPASGFHRNHAARALHLSGCEGMLKVIRKPRELLGRTIFLKSAIGGLRSQLYMRKSICRAHSFTLIPDSINRLSSRVFARFALVSGLTDRPPPVAVSVGSPPLSLPLNNLLAS